MTFFQVNHSEVQGTTFDPVPVGDYEVIISDVEKKVFKSGNKGLSLILTIRDDVDQAARKRKLFENLAITEKALFKYQQYAKATGMPDGQTFNTEEDIQNGFGQWLQGKCLRVRVKHENNDGVISERVAAVDASKLEAGAPTPQFGGGAHPFAPTGKDSPIGDISDDDLPF